MIPRRSFFIGFSLFIAIAGVFPANAAEFRPFTTRDFAAAQALGKPIVVDVFATWCPTCKAQEPVIKKIAALPKFKDLVIFRLDFDTQKAEWRGFKVVRQSTLIAFKGSRETARSIAETDQAALERVLNSTL